MQNNRFSQLVGTLLVLLSLLTMAMPAQAQVRSIPPEAGVGVLEMGVFPSAKINGTSVRFGAGARIFNFDSQIILPASLTSAVSVAYVADFQGLLRNVWLITDAQARALLSAQRNNR